MSDLRARIEEALARWGDLIPRSVIERALAESGPDAREGQGGLRERLMAEMARVRGVHTATPDESEHHPYKIRCTCGAWSYVHATHLDQVRTDAVLAVLAVVGRTVGAEEAWAEACKGFAWALDNGPADQAVEYVLAHNPYRTVTEGGEQDG